jgi:hypothetical protein
MPPQLRRLPLLYQNRRDGCNQCNRLVNENYDAIPHYFCIEAPLAESAKFQNQHRLQMDLIATITALTACTLVLTVTVALDRRPYRPGKLNYVPLMIICLAAFLVLGRHLLALIM